MPGVTSAHSLLAKASHVDKPDFNSAGKSQERELGKDPTGLGLVGRTSDYFEQIMQV